jgi:HAD superfamily hydrolase (TIGR01490 family)
VTSVPDHPESGRAPASRLYDRAALFDMDRTLIATTSARLYARYQRDRGEIGWYASARVAIWLVKYWLGIIAAEKVAAQVLLDFQGREEQDLYRSTEAWFKTYVLEHVRKTARETVDRHRRAGDLLAIVTAATGYAAWPLARELQIEHVISSEVEIDPSGRLTGKPVLPLCYGIGKVARAERFLESHGVALESATFYSDSITDLPLLERVGKPVVVCPDRRLRIVAARRGWPIESW